MSETAKEALESKETRDKAVDAAKTAAEKLLPEAQKLLKDRKAGDTAPAAAPSGAAAAPAVPPGPAPTPLQAVPDATQAQSKNAITIDADELTSDLKNAIFVYSGHVRARHPQFAIECEELEVHMVKEDEMPEKKEKPNVDPVQAPAAKKDANSRIKLAIARGPRVTIEKVSETGEIQRGQCKRAVYHGDTKEIVMSEYPQIQSGNLLHIATDPSTEMVFDPDGKFHATGGRQRTIVLSAETAPGGGASSPLDPLSNRKAQ
jgi:lipopolysaccharide export system protein LptA